MTYLKDRTMGYEFSASERNLLFNENYQNMGFVRIKSLREKSFFLDPSPYDVARKREYFILKDPSISIQELPKGQLIEVTVLEEDKQVIFKNGHPDHYLKVKYVSNFKPVHPNKIINGELILQEEFLNYLTIPLAHRGQWDMEDIQYGLGLSIVASPQLCDEIKGGINTAVLVNTESTRKYGSYKKITSIIPNEFKAPSCNNYYYFTERNEKINPLASSEVSGSYFNVCDYPVHVPIQFDVASKSPTEYKVEFDSVLPMARAFMLDTLLFRPHIPDNLYKRMEDAMRFIFDEYFSNMDVPFCVDLGNCVPKLITSFARLNFNNLVTSRTLDDSLKLWVTSFEHASRSKLTGFNPDGFYRANNYTDILRNEISDLYFSGMDIHISSLKANTKVPYWEFDETLEKLCIAGIVYHKSTDVLGFLDY